MLRHRDPRLLNPFRHRFATSEEKSSEKNLDRKQKSNRALHSLNRHLCIAALGTAQTLSVNVGAGRVTLCGAVEFIDTCRFIGSTESHGIGSAFGL
jgi:hypothetical protein